LNLEPDLKFGNSDNVIVTAQTPKFKVQQDSETKYEFQPSANADIKCCIECQEKFATGDVVVGVEYERIYVEGFQRFNDDNKTNIAWCHHNCCQNNSQYNIWHENDFDVSKMQGFSELETKDKKIIEDHHKKTKVNTKKTYSRDVVWLLDDHKCSNTETDILEKNITLRGLFEKHMNDSNRDDKAIKDFLYEHNNGAESGEEVNDYILGLFRTNLYTKLATEAEAKADVSSFPKDDDREFTLFLVNCFHKLLKFVEEGDEEKNFLVDL
jgi:hypothetical protein